MNKKLAIILFSLGTIIIGGISTSIFFIVKAANNHNSSNLPEKQTLINTKPKKYEPKKPIPWSNIEPSKQTKKIIPPIKASLLTPSTPVVKMKKIQPAVKPYYLKEEPSKTLIEGGLKFDPHNFDLLKNKMLESITYKYQKNGDLIIKAWEGKIIFYFINEVLTSEYLDGLANCMILVKRFINLNNFSTDIFLHGLYVHVSTEDVLDAGTTPAPFSNFNNSINLYAEKKESLTLEEQINSYASTLLHEYIHHLDFQFNSISTSGKNIFKNNNRLKETDIWNSKLNENVKEFFISLKNKDSKLAWKNFFNTSGNDKYSNYLKNNNPKLDKVKNWFMNKKSLQNMKSYYGEEIYPIQLKAYFNNLPSKLMPVKISYFSTSYHEPEMWPEITNFFLNKVAYKSIWFFTRIWRESGMNFIDTTYGRVAENIMGAFLHHYVGINNKNGLRLWGEKINGENYLNIDFSSIGKLETPNIENVVVTLKGNKYTIPIDHHKLPIGFRDRPSATRRHKYIADTASGTKKVKILPSMKFNPNVYKNIDIKINLKNQKVLSNKDTIVDIYRMISTNNIFIFDQETKKFVDIASLF